MRDSLTPGERRILAMIGTDGDECEPLTRATPGGWWIDNDRVSARVCWSLLRKALLRTTYQSNDGSYVLYRLNEEGERALADPTFVPTMVLMVTGREAEAHARYAPALPTPTRAPEAPSE